jgi:hypothetical protein
MFVHFRNAVRKRIGPGVGLAVVLAVWCCPTAVWGQLELAPQVRVLAHSPNLNAGHTLGYWPVVCVIENGSDRRYEIEVRCPETVTYRHVNWRALRKVTVEPRSTARVTLWLPAPAYSELALQFFVNGRQVDNTLRFSSLSRSGFMLAHTPRVLASSDAARFARGLVFGDHSDWLLRGFLQERQVRFELTEQPQQMYSSSWGPYSSSWVATMPNTGPVGIGPEAFIQRELALCVWDAPIRDWDNHWISYSAFQGMVLTPKDWWEAPAEVQEAIIRWVTLGGSLVFLDVHTVAPPKKPAATDTPQGTLVLEDFAPGDESLQKTALARRQEILSSFPATDAMAAVLAVEKSKGQKSDGQNDQQPKAPEVLPQLEPELGLTETGHGGYLPCGFGQVYYVLVQTHQPTPVSPGQTRQVLVTSRVAGQALTNWGKSVESCFRVSHELLASEYPREQLLRQAFTGVQGIGVPVLGFFVILLLFSALIGPVTLFVLGRFKRRIWLIWVVPVIALTGSLVVFLYGFLAEGVSARIGVRALTVLDERHHRASTLGVLAIYSPITPPGGIQLDYDTEPTFFETAGEYDPYGRYGPYGPYGRRYYARRASQPRQTVVDWSEKQHLVSGWVVPRVTEYATVRRCEVRRERLELRRDGGRLFAANGLGCGVRKLLLCDHDGRWWSADSLPAGQEIELQPCDPPAEYQSAVDIWVRIWKAPWSQWRTPIPPTPPGHIINPPDERIGPPSDVFVRPGETKPTIERPLSLPSFFPGTLHNWLVLGSGSSGLRHWSAELLAEDGPKAHQLLCPGRYLAELEESRFLGPGLRWVKSREERCWVLGIFDPPR